jgi:hypothetical protein
MYDRGRIMTEEERHEIIEFVCAIFFETRSRPDKLVLSYDLTPLDKSIPISIWRIKKRIVERENLYPYSIEPIFRDFIGIILTGGSIGKHTDKNIGEFVHTRFNVFIELPNGHVKTYYGNKEVDSKKGHYTMCRSGMDMHYTDTNIHYLPRITLSFGFLIPRRVLNTQYMTIPRAIVRRESEYPWDIEILTHILQTSIQSFGFKLWSGGYHMDKIKDLRIQV